MTSDVIEKGIIKGNPSIGKEEELALLDKKLDEVRGLQLTTVTAAEKDEMLKLLRHLDFEKAKEKRGSFIDYIELDKEYSFDEIVTIFTNYHNRSTKEQVLEEFDLLKRTDLDTGVFSSSLNHSSNGILVNFKDKQGNRLLGQNIYMDGYTGQPRMRA